MIMIDLKHLIEGGRKILLNLKTGGSRPLETPECIHSMLYNFNYHMTLRPHSKCCCVEGRFEENEKHHLATQRIVFHLLILVMLS